MSLVERRDGTAPEGIEYRVSIHDFTLSIADHVRRRRRIEFESENGRVVGSTPCPSFLALDVVSTSELEIFWERAVGE